MQLNARIVCHYTWAVVATTIGTTALDRLNQQDLAGGAAVRNSRSRTSNPQAVHAAADGHH